MNKDDCTIQITYNRTGRTFRYGLNGEQSCKVISYVKKQLDAPFAKEESRGTLIGLFED